MLVSKIRQFRKNKKSLWVCYLLTIVVWGRDFEVESLWVFPGVEMNSCLSYSELDFKKQTDEITRLETEYDHWLTEFQMNLNRYRLESLSDRLVVRFPQTWLPWLFVWQDASAALSKAAIEKRVVEAKLFKELTVSQKAVALSFASLKQSTIKRFRGSIFDPQLMVRCYEWTDDQLNQVIKNRSIITGQWLKFHVQAEKALSFINQIKTSKNRNRNWVSQCFSSKKLGYIRAIAKGRVISAVHHQWLGPSVFILESNGQLRGYYQIGQVRVSVGDHIESGQILSDVGYFSHQWCTVSTFVW